MSRESVIQLGCLYGPLAAAALLLWWRPPGRREAVGLLFAWCWMAAVLPWLDALAQAAGWWSYQATGLTLGEMPLALYFGWTLAWGVVAPLLARALGDRPWAAAGIVVALDILIMPEMRPVLQLKSAWLVGEAVACVLLLAPSLALVRWTTARCHTSQRAALLVPAFGGLLFGLPLLVVAGGATALADRWSELPAGLRLGYPLAVLAAAVPGMAAVRDLGRSGDGTPVPLDPPRHLVTHGVYAFVRNPMQFSLTLLLLLGAAFVGSPWPAVLAGLGVAYSEGLARWSETEDMSRRFGKAWTEYRAAVRPWWPRWRPGPGTPCELWFDSDCGPCREVADWFRHRSPAALVLRVAADWPAAPLRRITWRHPDSGRTESGVAAVAMALQHLHLGWAALGWIASLPGLPTLLQCCLDAAGAGPRSGRPGASKQTPKPL